VLLISAGVPDFRDEMVGVASLLFRVSGRTGEVSVERLCENAGEDRSTETVDSLRDC